MLYLKRNTINLPLVSLLDRTINTFGLNTWSYLLSFTNDMSKESVTTLVTNENMTAFILSGATNVILKIKEMTGTLDGTDGEIKLYPKGYWSYEIYEQESITNLDITASVPMAKIQVGKAYVYDTTDEVQYTEHIDTTNTTNYIYIK